MRDARAARRARPRRSAPRRRSTPPRSRVALPVTAGPDELVAAVRALDVAGVALDDIALRRPTLDDVFLTLTGHTTDADAHEEVLA